jgi:SAM-dependent methyltransferase
MSPISDALRQFTADYPWERGPILEFMQRAAAELPSGARVLDVGAGQAPYAELFQHVDYRTSDWEHSVHPNARRADYIGSADDLPIQDWLFDAVINTQVLEHVAEPARVLAELFRVLRPGGTLYLSVPLVWELHEEPHDYYRYTPHSLRYLLERAGFVGLDIQPRSDSLSAIAQMLSNAAYLMGRRADGLDSQRDIAGHTMRYLAHLVASYAPLDTQRIFPLGYTVCARRPARIDGTRSIAVGSFATELLSSPGLLSAYASAFSAADDATLVVLIGPDELDAVSALASSMGFEDDAAADVLVIPVAAMQRGALDALLSAEVPTGLLEALPRFESATLPALRVLFERIRLKRQPDAVSPGP